jgi:hypothetical protein
VNGDGRADAVLCQYGSGNASVMLSRGDGSFDPPQSSHVGSGGSPATHWFATLDVNGDGRKDVVRYGPDSIWRLIVSVSNGTGTFLAPAHFNANAAASPSDSWLMTGRFGSGARERVVLYNPNSGFVHSLEYIHNNP